jgi:predicted RNA-binding Zn-ribbon protein involved in translation (DUF1610 family)
LIGIGVVIWLVSESDKKKYSSSNYSYDSSSYSNKLSKKNRATHCHSCKTNLTSVNEKECSSCGWLICPHCGACEYNCSKSKSHSNKAIAVGATAVAASFAVSKDEDVEGYADEEIYETYSSYDYYEYESSYDDEPEIDTSVDLGYAEEIDWEDRY